MDPPFEKGTIWSYSSNAFDPHSTHLPSSLRQTACFVFEDMDLLRWTRSGSLSEVLLKNASNFSSDALLTIFLLHLAQIVFLKNEPGSLTLYLFALPRKSVSQISHGTNNQSKTIKMPICEMSLYESRPSGSSEIGGPLWIVTVYSNLACSELDVVLTVLFRW